MLQGRTLTSTIAWRSGIAVSTETFLHDVHALASRLPPVSHAINLCEHHYDFLVGFAALLVNGQTCVLPPCRAEQVIDEITGDYPDICCLYSGTPPDIAIPRFRVDTGLQTDTDTSTKVPQVTDEHVAAILFTSGSTGTPQAHEKTWKDLVAGARMKRKCLGLDRDSTQQTIVATVPPQHMYGLEMAIMNTLVNGACLGTDRSFFPADIQQTLQGLPGERMLVTTPVHLASCIASGLDWPPLDAVISATAPLDQSLAQQAEQTFDCPVLEIYGSTETGSLAIRRTLEDEHWRLHEDITLREHSTGHVAVGAHLPGEVPLQDIITPVNDRQFRLHGRHTDMIKVAGKRASLDDLNIQLRSIEGVEDGAFVVPDEDTVNTRRLAALVVAPTLDSAQIRRELTRRIDSAFLPRPLVRVDALPRNETGKLPRSALLEILEKARTRG